MKLPVKLTLFFCLMCTLGLSVAVKERPCNIAYRCSTVEDPVWVTDGESCQVIRNECFLLNENCNRQNNYQPELQKIPKEDCQKLCSSECPEDNNPVCGYYNDKTRTFANACEMKKHICNTGETYDLYRLESCV